MLPHYGYAYQLPGHLVIASAAVQGKGLVAAAAGAFLADPAAPRYGYDLMKAARLPSGALYPLLA